MRLALGILLCLWLVPVAVAAENTPPTISAISCSIAAGYSVHIPVANVSDAETPLADLVVTVTRDSGIGVTMSSLSVDANGVVSGDIAAACDATDSTFIMTVTDSGGLSSDSRYFAFVFPLPATFYREPEDQDGCIGKPVTFFGIGNASQSYQWKKNGELIPGANQYYYTIPSVSQADGGDVYSLVITGPCNSVESHSVHVNVNDVPSFSAPVESRAACLTDSVTFEAHPVNSTFGQWEVGGLTGVSSLTYTIGYVTRDWANFTYAYDASNACGIVSSNHATLTVLGPTLQASNVSVNAGANCSAQVPAIAYTVTSCAQSLYSVEQVPAAGTSVGVGDHEISLVATDWEGVQTTTKAHFIVLDTPPQVTASISPSILWPPNHQMVPVTVSAVAKSLCSTATCHITSVVSNEPDNGLGDGDMAPDYAITGPLSLSLRAERSGTGRGRTYTVTLECGTATRQLTVTVPKNQK